MAERNLEYLGRGFSFPFAFSVVRGGVLSRSQVAQASEVEKVRMSIWQILGTSIGSRPMLRSFGSRIRQTIFAPIGPDTNILVGHYVKQAVETWEPRVFVQNVTVSDQARSEGRLDIGVDFVIKATYEPGSIVFPYYLSEGERASWAAAFENGRV